MLNNILYPEMTKEMKTVLLKEAKDGIREVNYISVFIGGKTESIAEKSVNTLALN